MCFHKGPLVFRNAVVIWTLYFSRFLNVSLCRSCLSAKVRNLVSIICSLLVGIDYLWPINWKLHFLERKTHSFGLKSPEPWKSHFRDLKFQNFPGKNVPRPPPPSRKRGLTAPCWYSWLLDSNLLATSIFIETLKMG